MTALDDIVTSLDRFFAVRDLTQDPAMGRNLPRVYDAIGFDWRSAFEPDFVARFKSSSSCGATWGRGSSASLACKRYCCRSSIGGVRLDIRNPISTKSGF